MSSAKGMHAERLAAQFLVERGVQVLCSNYRCKFGEIDLVAREAEALCFVEVRFRRRSRFGYAIETVGTVKRRRLIKTAEHFLAYRWSGRPTACRFDVVTVEGTEPPIVEWWRGAFDAGQG